MIDDMTTRFVRTISTAVPIEQVKGFGQTVFFDGTLRFQSRRQKLGVVDGVVLVHILIFRANNYNGETRTAVPMQDHQKKNSKKIRTIL
jgi:hypothetical protein